MADPERLRILKQGLFENIQLASDIESPSTSPAPRDDIRKPTVFNGG